jgi:hypothetical protein
VSRGLVTGAEASCQMLINWQYTADMLAYMQFVSELWI